jgi:D-arabinitol 2-dehydrogenase
MFRSQFLRQKSRAIRACQSPIISRTLPSVSGRRAIHDTPPNQKDEQEKQEGYEASFARTDPSVQVEYPEESELPSSTPVQGRGGMHFRRTLASFSLEGRVGIVTGGARGLGLVMSQAMVISGADVAIVDLNSEFHCSSRLQASFTKPITQRRKQKSKPRNWSLLS